MKYTLAFLSSVLCLMPLAAYDWPSPDVQVIRTFGQKSGGAVLPGVEVQTLAPSLSAPENGDVVFAFRPGSQLVQDLPSALGGFVALAHDDNLRSVTSRITPVPLEAKRAFRRGEPLGQTEVLPGASESRHRIFVFDQQLGELVNPLLVFPALADAKAPLIFDVKVIPEGQGDPVSLFGKSSLAVGYWDIRVDVSDPVTYLPAPGKDRGPEGQRGVYAVEAYLNGSEVFNTTLDSLQEKGGRWQIKGLGSFLDDVLVEDQEWNLGQVFFNQGTNILEISVRDFQGNQAGKTFRVLGTR
jgi:hypothetical protein